MKRISAAVFSFCLLGLAFTACNRDKVDPDQACNVQSVKNEKNELVSEYTYDAQKRLTKFSRYSNGAPGGYTAYEYAPAKVLERNYSGAGGLLQMVTYELGPDGLAQRSYTSSQTATATRFDTTVYTFDSKGYRARELRASTFVQPDGSRQTVQSDYEYNMSPTGDLSLLRITNDTRSSANTLYDFLYDYHSTPNRNPNTRPYLGKQSKNHVKSLTYLINGEVQFENLYTHSLDKRGYISRTDLTRTQNGSSEQSASVYAYVCN